MGRLAIGVGRNYRIWLGQPMAAVTRQFKAKPFLIDGHEMGENMNFDFLR
jgi:hypothetical protein